MTHEQFDKKLDDTFTVEEIALLNINVYYNPDHIEYYKNYHMEKYQDCYDFLVKNRKLLSIENTPPDKLDTAKMMLEMAKRL